MITHKSLIFQPAEILLPAGNLRKWSVIACDQFTSDGEYWAEVERFVGENPSALRLMLPEYYLGFDDETDRMSRILQTMRDYLYSDVFRSYPDSLVYLERRLSDGKLRRGLIGVIDLEAFDYSDHTDAPIRASEHTVENRLPPRIKVRRQACLEMPHILLFYDDSEDAVMGQAAAYAAETLYDFDLMGGGGHVLGRRICGDAAWRLSEAVSGKDGFRFAVGDGNHSLAAARNCWLEQKQNLPEAEWSDHPARFALVELVNIHSSGVCFAPIHRVLFQTDSAHWFSEAKKRLYDSNGREATFVCGSDRLTLPVKGSAIGELIDQVEQFCKWYCLQFGGRIDYIHGDDEAQYLSQEESCCGVLLPLMQKEELFESVSEVGPFPKKSFSIGLGTDKRYYLECRRINKK